MLRGRHHSRGFTLLEVMVALAVVGVSIYAIVFGVGQGAVNAVHLKHKTLAHWVAMNKVAELQLEQGWPSVGIRKGEYDMASREWHWETKVSETEDQDVRRLDVDVYEDAGAEQSLAKVIAYLGKPTASGGIQ